MAFCTYKKHYLSIETVFKNKTVIAVEMVFISENSTNSSILLDFWLIFFLLLHIHHFKLCVGY